jgi:hypothetical protein
MKNKDYTHWWKHTVVTIPFIALALLIIIDFIGWTELHNKVLFFILIGFFTLGVIWWWWAVDTIVSLTKTLISADEKFLELKKEISSIKEDVKSLDESSKK